MAVSPRREDRRIQRTRQLLKRASIEIMQKKGVPATSIQEITERANVNRGTFYDHFADKYALLETLIRDEFHHLVCVLPPVSYWNSSVLQHLIQLVLENFRDVQRRCRPLGDIDPLTQRIIQEELAVLLLAWLTEKRKKGVQDTVSLQTAAGTMSWAILGAALQWSLEPGSMASEQMAHGIVLLLLHGVAHLTDEDTPDQYK
ncbi:TetR/AcrR family transcriptional regulator [Reticulibacter mediterranei]|uniref:TetR/AcrR family transcriptional regulator n=2 Tax=Reticulibacter mediterranei TaxID=2778369 RepID=A0A8J3IXX7_9CHLR|nr:TetR/AcrR family transcriptional regulator [Reticulibacter mediterranei]